MLRRMLGYMRPYRRLLALLFTMALAVGLLNIAQPQILGRLTSALFNGRHGVELPGGRVLLRSVKSVVILPGLLLNCSSPDPACWRICREHWRSE